MKGKLSPRGVYLAALGTVAGVFSICSTAFPDSLFFKYSARITLSLAALTAIALFWQRIRELTSIIFHRRKQLPVASNLLLREEVARRYVKECDKNKKSPAIQIAALTRIIRNQRRFVWFRRKRFCDWCNQLLLDIDAINFAIPEETSLTRELAFDLADSFSLCLSNYTSRIDYSDWQAQNAIKILLSLIRKLGLSVNEDSNNRPHTLEFTAELLQNIVRISAIHSHILFTLNPELAREAMRLSSVGLSIEPIRKEVSCTIAENGKELWPSNSISIDELRQFVILVVNITGFEPADQYLVFANGFSSLTHMLQPICNDPIKRNIDKEQFENIQSSVEKLCVKANQLNQQEEGATLDLLQRAAIFLRKELVAVGERIEKFLELNDEDKTNLLNKNKDLARLLEGIGNTQLAALSKVLVPSPDLGNAAQEGAHGSQKPPSSPLPPRDKNSGDSGSKQADNI